MSRTEPVRLFVILSTLVTAALNGATLFDLVDLTVDQYAYIDGLTALVAAAFGATIVRGAVTPNATVVQQAHVSYVMGLRNSARIKEVTGRPE